MNGPIEPWAGSLRALMLAFGALLLVCFVAPWRVSGETVFAWDHLSSADSTYLKLVPLLFAASGLVALLLAVLPVATAGRGLAAASVGLIAVVATAATEPGAGWRPSAQFVAMIALVAGLLLRSQYRSSTAARLIVTTSALAIIALWLIPAGGSVPFVAAFEALGTDIPAGMKIVLLADMLIVVVAALSLLAWISAPSSAGAGALAWVVIALLPAKAVITMIVVPDTAHDVFDTILLPFASAAWVALGGFGAATLLGKKLETP